MILFASVSFICYPIIDCDLRKHALNRLAIRQRKWPPVAVVDVSVRVEAESRKNGGGEVAGGVGVGGGVLAEAVAFAVDEAPFHAGSGEDDGVALRPVVSRRFPIRCLPKFAVASSPGMRDRQRI